MFKKLSCNNVLFSLVTPGGDKQLVEQRRHALQVPLSTAPTVAGFVTRGADNLIFMTLIEGI